MGIARAFRRWRGDPSRPVKARRVRRLAPIIELVENLSEAERAVLAKWAARHPNGVLTPEVLRRVLEGQEA